MKRLLHNVGSYHGNTRVIYLIFQATMKQMQDEEHERFCKVLCVRLGEIGLEIAPWPALAQQRTFVDRSLSFCSAMGHALRSSPRAVRARASTPRPAISTAGDGTRTCRLPDPPSRKMGSGSGVGSLDVARTR